MEEEEKKKDGDDDVVFVGGENLDIRFSKEKHLKEFFSPAVQRKTKKLLDKALNLRKKNLSSAISLIHDNDENDFVDFKHNKSNKAKALNIKPLAVKRTRKAKSEDIKSEYNCVQSVVTKSSSGSTSSSHQNGLTNEDENSDSDHAKKTCHICQQEILTASMQEHVFVCMKSNFEHQKKVTDKDLRVEKISCPVCGTDLQFKCLTSRSEHINKCLDQSDPEKNKGLSEEEYNKWLEKARVATMGCPMCGKKLQKAETRLRHLKQCAQANNLNVEQLRALIGQQAEEYHKQLDAGVLPQEFRPPAKSVKLKGKGTRKPSKFNEDIKLAKALSASTNEFHQGGKNEKIRNLKKLEGGKKSKKDKSPTLLMSLSKTQAIERISNQVASYVLNAVPEEELSQTPPFIRKTKPCAPKSNSLWNKSSLDFLSDSTSSLSLSNPSSSSSLQPQLLSSSLSEFYVDELTSVVSMSTVVPGSKLKRSSDIPGRGKSFGPTDVLTAAQNDDKLLTYEAPQESQVPLFAVSLDHSSPVASQDVERSQTVDILAQLAVEHEMTTQPLQNGGIGVRLAGEQETTVQLAQNEKISNQMECERILQPQEDDEIVSRLVMDQEIINKPTQNNENNLKIVEYGMTGQLTPLDGKIDGHLATEYGLTKHKTHIDDTDDQLAIELERREVSESSKVNIQLAVEQEVTKETGSVFNSINQLGTGKKMSEQVAHQSCVKGSTVKENEDDRHNPCDGECIKTETNIVFQYQNDSKLNCDEDSFKNAVAEMDALSSAYLTLVDNSDHSDVIIRVKDDQSIAAHLNIISVRCPRLLDSIITLGNDKVLPLQDYEKASVIHVLHYIYAGRITSVPADNLEEVTRLAEKLHLYTLVTSSLNNSACNNLNTTKTANALDIVQENTRGNTAATNNDLFNISLEDKDRLVLPISFEKDSTTNNNCSSEPEILPFNLVNECTNKHLEKASNDDRNVSEKFSQDGEMSNLDNRIISPETSVDENTSQLFDNAGAVEASLHDLDQQIKVLENNSKEAENNSCDQEEASFPLVSSSGKKSDNDDVEPFDILTHNHLELQEKSSSSITANNGGGFLEAPFDDLRQVFKEVGENCKGTKDVKKEMNEASCHVTKPSAEESQMKERNNHENEENFANTSFGDEEINAIVGIGNSNLNTANLTEMNISCDLVDTSTSDQQQSTNFTNNDQVSMDITANISVTNKSKKKYVSKKQFKEIISKVGTDNTMKDEEFERITVKIEQLCQKDGLYNLNDSVFIPSVLEDAKDHDPDELEIISAQICSPRHKKRIRQSTPTKGDTPKRKKRKSDLQNADYSFSSNTVGQPLQGLAPSIYINNIDKAERMKSNSCRFDNSEVNGLIPNHNSSDELDVAETSLLNSDVCNAQGSINISSPIEKNSNEGYIEADKESRAEASELLMNSDDDLFSDDGEEPQFEPSSRVSETSISHLTEAIYTTMKAPISQLNNKGMQYKGMLNSSIVSKDESMQSSSHPLAQSDFQSKIDSPQMANSRISFNDSLKHSRLNILPRKSTDNQVKKASLVSCGDDHDDGLNSENSPTRKKVLHRNSVVPQSPISVFTNEMISHISQKTLSIISPQTSSLSKVSEAPITPLSSPVLSSPIVKNDDRNSNLVDNFSSPSSSRPLLHELMSTSEKGSLQGKVAATTEQASPSFSPPQATLSLRERLGLTNPFGLKPESLHQGKNATSQQKSSALTHQKDPASSKSKASSSVSMSKPAVPAQRKFLETKHQNVEVSTQLRTIPVKASTMKMSYVNAGNNKELKQKICIKDTIPSPFSPMAPYDDMNTPELKKAVSKIGVRPMGKKGMKQLLKHVYQETHKYETDTDGESTPVKRVKEKTSHTSIHQLSKKSLFNRNNDVEYGSSCSTEESRETDFRSKIRAYQDGINGEHVRPAPSLPNCLPEDHEEDDLIGSQDSSSSEGPDLPEESILQMWPEEEETDLCTQLTQTSAEALTAKLMNFLKDNPSIYEKILMYEALELDVLKKQISEAGIRIGLAKLQDFLDERCITFSMKNMSNRNNRQPQQRRKKTTGKSPRKTKPNSTASQSKK